ncbi:MAG TPA: hypothetical protein VJZ68_01255 [Nitrososphaera sp.]|nr:hypothetical protein [Nitrososphaera sp.]
MKSERSYIATLRGREALELLKALESDKLLRYEQELVKGKLVMMFGVDG